MTQHEVDEALEEHRAVMAAHYRECINRPTDEQYKAQLDVLREVMGKCVSTETTTSPSPLPSSGHS